MTRASKRKPKSISKKYWISKSEDIQMRASDILYIPQSRTKEFLLQVVQMSLAIATSAAIYRIGYTRECKWRKTPKSCRENLGRMGA